MCRVCEGKLGSAAAERQAITDILCERWQAPSVLEACCFDLQEAAVPSEALWQLPVCSRLALLQEPSVVLTCHTNIAAWRNGIWYHAFLPAACYYVKLALGTFASMEVRHHVVVSICSIGGDARVQHTAHNGSAAVLAGRDEPSALK